MKSKITRIKELEIESLCYAYVARVVTVYNRDQGKNTNWKGILKGMLKDLELTFDLANIQFKGEDRKKEGIEYAKTIVETFFWELVSLNGYETKEDIKR